LIDGSTKGECKMRKAMALLACATVLAFVGPVKAFAAATDCSGDLGGDPIPVAGGNLPDAGPAPGVIPINDAKKGPLYIDVRHVMSGGSSFSVWIYQESDGIDGLQRGGHSLTPDVTAAGLSGQETCDVSSRFGGKHDQDLF
jgi:hypothetical protein